MKIRVKTMLAATVLAVAAGATSSVAQADLTVYHYVYYADAAKTQYLGEISDYGCGQSGRYVYVRRAQVPSPYYDATPIYVCTGGGPTLPEDW